MRNFYDEWLRAADLIEQELETSSLVPRDNAGHILWMADGRPHTILKLANSADGKVGLAGRRPVQITGSSRRGPKLPEPIRLNASPVPIEETTIDVP